MSDAGSVYQVNRAVNKPVEFKGIKAQYILFTGAGLVLLLIVFVCCYLLGVNTYLLLGMLLPAGAGMILLAIRVSKQYGEHGLSKFISSKQMPICVRSKTWKPFFLSGK